MLGSTVGVLTQPKPPRRLEYPEVVEVIGRIMTEALGRFRINFSD